MTARTSQNDIERFESLYGANAKVRRRAVNSSSDVSDIVSEVFTTAWRRINDVPPFPQDRLWLFGVAHKCLLGHPRRWSHRLRLLSHLGSQPNRIAQGCEDRIRGVPRWGARETVPTCPIATSGVSKSSETTQEFLLWQAAGGKSGHSLLIEVLRKRRRQ